MLLAEYYYGENFKEYDVRKTCNIYGGVRNV
jgi:hypothetical protein